MAADVSDTADFTIKRDPGGPGFVRRAWKRWWVKVLAFFAALIGLAYLALLIFVLPGLPSVDSLKTYEPPLPSNVRDTNGMPVYSYARERRVQLSFDEYPKLLVGAYLSAEDKTFFSHHGVDFLGIASAVFDNLTSGKRARGASTITQQVAKNLLVGNEASYTRKLKEAILAYRIENVLTKQQILEIYLNTIFLGRNAYGVEAAAHAYFDKDVNQLTLPQYAYLAILPKAPSGYDPDRQTARALARRNYVLNEMLANNYITQAQHDAAVASPLGTVNKRTASFESVPGYFMEEVRRQLMEKFGENADGGRNPYSVYSGGLWVRTSFDPNQQALAQKALRDGLLRYDRGRGWTGPLGHVTIGTSWQSALLGSNIALDYEDWRAAMVIDAAGDFRLGFADGSTGTMPRGAASMPIRGGGGSAASAIKVGDIVAVSPAGGSFALQTVPKISGGFLVEEPATGRVLAMQGGFDSRIQSFNRTTQAMRQPGSTIKPVVYAAALQAGLTPASIIVDGPFCVSQGSRGQKCFRNFGGGAGSGPHTMRWGVEQSRNLMTVRAAAQTGMGNVVKLMDQISVVKYPPYLAFSLGAGETTVSRMVNAYSILENNGRGRPSTLIDYVQDRHGKVIWPDNWRACDRCNAPDWNGKPMPRPVVRLKQIVEPMSAYQMVHIAEGVIQRGTAVVLRDLDRPMFGKTGTNSGPKDVWFIGGTPQMIAGVYMGYDSPVNLGGYAQGGTIAAPIFKAWAVKAYEGMPKLPFRAPAGIRMVRIDRTSGRPVFGAWPSDKDPKAGVIWEAFKPESEPRRGPIRRDLPVPTATKAPPPAKPTDSGDGDFLQRQGGIY
ncbi:transglycosylase domain-containing protein [Sphingomonas bacterium]|uniref:penicillin-binding protein 1A n=1 Tax=Sphingomonas bacterium TaxID=1895847 RepID=UPI0026186F4F|nr:transglycosylase domain-containing protein [Sphingomonas bacterium]MDB5677139.1 penicillin-binding protein [Sphingomonas bacterium]